MYRPAWTQAQPPPTHTPASSPAPPPYLQLDSKDELRVIADIAEVKQCNNVLFFDVRKKRDCYLWMAHTPSGPSVKFHLVNVHTMDELRLTGNCLRGSRPLLSFDAAFDAQPHLQLLKEMFIQTFNTPQGHPKSQPFHDHIMSFFVLDNMVWVRHYQIVDAALTAKEAKKLLATGSEPTSLVEIGPRFVLNIVRIFKGAFGGPTLFTNPDFRSPNALRHDMAAAKSAKHEARGEARMSAKARAAAKLPKDPLASVFTAGLPGEAPAADASDDGSSDAASDSE